MFIKSLKSWQSICIALLLVGVILSGCSKSNSSGAPASVFTATINGKAFTPTVAGGVDVTSGNFFYIAGNLYSSGDTSILSISMPDTSVVNTPLLFDGLNTIMTYQDIKTGVIYSNQGNPDAPGSIVITTLIPQSLLITGTFSGTLYNQSNINDSVVVTIGKFNVTYTTQ